MRIVFSVQYGVPCVVAEAGDTADDILEWCSEEGAVLDHGDGDEFVVELRPDIGPELYTEAAIRRSLPAGGA
jgi:hypothetical protein